MGAALPAIGLIGTVLGGVGTAVSVYGQIQQARLAREEAAFASAQAVQQAQFQSTQLQQQAQIERENAILSRENLLQDIERRRDIGEKQKGAQLARFGAAGTLPTVESLAETGLQTELDVVNMERADIELDNYLQRVQQLEQESGFVRAEGQARASAIRREGEAASISSLMGAGGTLLSGTSSLIKKLPKRTTEKKT